MNGNHFPRRLCWICLSVFTLTLLTRVGNSEDEHTGHSTEHSMSGAANHDMTHDGMSAFHEMAMYSAALLSGCEDYHCLKCTSRNHCSLGADCGMPECGHEHARVDCHGMPVLYLRSSAGNSSCMARAEKVVRQLNTIVSLKNPENWDIVVKNVSREPEIWLQMTGMAQGYKLVEVTEADVIGYRHRATVVQRSHNADSIDKALVAKWWAALLQDHFDSMILGKEPSQTVHTHCGKPLLKAYIAARERVAHGPIPMKTWMEVYSTVLSPTDRDRLGMVAQIIPKNFSN